MNQEIWKPIKGYEKYYLINNQGIIKRINQTNPRWLNRPIMEHHPNTSGYGLVNLSNPKKTFAIHRLVAKHFVYNPYNLLEVNHKDGNKKNNNASNLEWCTRSHNIKEAFRMGARCSKGINNGRHKLTEEDIKHIRKSQESIISLSNKYSVWESTIRNIRLRKSWRHIT